MTMDDETLAEPLDDHPCVVIADVAPIFVRQMILGAMAIQYIKAAGVEFDDGYASARATWNTEWPDDPQPRTFEAARDVVDDDLAYWDED